MGLFNFLFKKMCHAIFRSVDRDNSGSIEQIEIEVAVYRLYNIINKRLPGWQDPPSREDIAAALRTYDANHNGVLDKDEFVAFAKALVHSGPDVFFARLGKDAIVRTAIMPLAGLSVKQGANAAGFQQLGNAPLHVVAPLVGVVFRTFRALLPIGL